MVKPAGPYLDIIREVRESTILPVAAYQSFRRVCSNYGCFRKRLARFEGQS